MYRYKRLMVELKLDEQDAALIRYAALVSKMAKSAEICFIYVSDSFDIPDEIKKLYPEISAPKDEAAKVQMQDHVAQYFNGWEETALTFETVEGQLPGTLISRAKDYDIDLVLVGNAFDAGHPKSSMAEKIARKAPCSVLIVPDKSPLRLSSVLVAIDFSDHGRNALDVGSAFAKAAGLDTMDLVKVCQVPGNYEKTGKTYAEFSGILVKNAKMKLRRYIPTVDLKGLKISPHYTVDQNVVHGIKQLADRKNAHLVVIGARGRTGDIAAILLGSVTEGLIRTLPRPLLAVKKKGEGLGIMQALSAS